MAFGTKILAWYEQHKRDLPWRIDKNPYTVWLSEVILQQTRVDQGMPYFNRFKERYPRLEDLANASEDEVLKLWQGLGYYSRARNMLFTAKYIHSELGGEFPSSAKELLQLKGVGEYTASAIASICFDEEVAVVDGNVYRVLSRYFGESLPINSTEGIKAFKELANLVMDKNQPGDYNQGIMEFGSLQCVPVNPDCSSCPLQNGCNAHSTNRVTELPLKLKKTKVQTKYYNYMVIIDSNERIVIEQRKGKGIWNGLYQFPLLETSEKATPFQIEAHIKTFPYINQYELSLYNQEAIIHKLSHRKLHTHFWIIQLNYPIEKAIPKSQLTNFAVPVLIANFLKAFKIY